MISGRRSSSWSYFCARGLAVVLVLGVIAMHVPFPVRLPTDRCDSSESCGSCERESNGPLGRQASCGEREATLHLKHSGRETPDGEPCCPNGCEHCALPCCGGATMAIAPPETSVGHPVATLIAPVAVGIPPTIKTAGIFHPPRI